MAIPKIIHIIWVGDETKRPDTFIKTWREKHPTWDIKVWGNEELVNHSWRCRPQIEKFVEINCWEGVADIMRLEILYQQGGIYIDADAISVRPLDEEFLLNKMFAIYESEVHSPGLVANGFIGSEPGHIILEEMISHISRLKNPAYRRKRFHLKKKRTGSWRTVGPKLFTIVVKRHPGEITLFPSIIFLPQHYKDQVERAGGPIYARHVWGKTFDSYGHIGKETTGQGQ